MPEEAELHLEYMIWFEALEGLRTDLGNIIRVVSSGVWDFILKSISRWTSTEAEIQNTTASAVFLTIFKLPLKIPNAMKVQY